MPPSNRPAPLLLILSTSAATDVRTHPASIQVQLTPALCRPQNKSTSETLQPHLYKISVTRSPTHRHTHNPSQFLPLCECGPCADSNLRLHICIIPPGGCTRDTSAHDLRVDSMSPSEPNGFICTCNEIRHAPVQPFRVYPHSLPHVCMRSKEGERRSGRNPSDACFAVSHM